MPSPTPRVPRARCPICDEEAAVVLTGGTEVTVGSVAASLEQRPVVDCAAGHRGTPSQLVGAAMETADERVVRARSRLLRSDACVDCGTPLTLPVRRTVKSFTVVSEVAPVVTIHLDLPATRCPSCALDQVPSRSQEDLVVVIPAVFAASPGA